MSARQTDITWKAEPHTIAKIKVLEAYLVAYFQILGTSKSNQTLLYVDGFAGPDEYKNFPHGSPSAALSAAREALHNSQDRWVAGKLHCAFIESIPKRFENMVRKIEPFHQISGLCIHTYNTDFVNGLAKLRSDVPAPFAKADPLFVFIDPFGATGAPFDTVRDLLTSDCSEILINLDADGIGRIFQAKESANHDTLLTAIYGDRAWTSWFDKTEPFPLLCRRALRLYTEKLKSIADVRYVFAFEMQSSSGALNYFLVFASKHPLGLVKMKEAMKRIDQDGSYRFSDADVSQPSLLRFDDPAPYARELHKQFEGRSVNYESLDNEITNYALNDTPFRNAKQMLVILEKQGLIQVKTENVKRRKGTFKEGDVRAVEFLRVTQAFQF
ncbi:MAG: three-Cys-motif partner protein TcmP [Verrucomicrobia bacterium]|nr:three-Cys-motif partner protein TcmP [Verrucomicrobiota bacterium]